MDKLPFNKLSPAQAERLALLAEECAEVIKCVGKILRHGYESFDPTGKEVGTNRIQLATEIGHIAGVVDFMIEHGHDLDSMMIITCGNAKFDKMKAGTYLHHQNDPSA